MKLTGYFSCTDTQGCRYLVFEYSDVGTARNFKCYQLADGSSAVFMTRDNQFVISTTGVAVVPEQ